MSLAALDLFSGVEATWSAGFSCFDALTVNDCGSRFFIATAKLTRDANERLVEKIEDAAITELSMAERKCARWRRKSVPVRFREKGHVALLVA
jgi:hypothetical protein